MYGIEYIIIILKIIFMVNFIGHLYKKIIFFREHEN